jgi:hypothetical protein
MVCRTHVRFAVRLCSVRLWFSSAKAHQNVNRGLPKVKKNGSRPESLGISALWSRFRAREPKIVAPPAPQILLTKLPLGFARTTAKMPFPQPLFPARAGMEDLDDGRTGTEELDDGRRRAWWTRAAGAGDRGEPALGSSGAASMAPPG